MSQSKVKTAAIMGIDLLAGQAGMPLTKSNDTPQTLAARNARPDDIGKEIQRRAGYGKVTVESIQVYLENLRKCGIYVKSALAAGLSYSSIANLRARDPDFAMEEEQAKKLWIAEFIDEPFRQIAHGEWVKPHYNQKTGQLMGTEKIISPQIALAFARKFDPEYREKVEVDNKHSGGVIVVTAPVAPQDLEAYARNLERQSREVIDEAPAPGQNGLPANGRNGSIPAVSSAPPTPSGNP